jgi:hypothetical protein
MLTASGYLGGLIIYCGAALLALLLFNLWFLRGARWGTRCLLVFPLAALLLTPAYYEAGADTLAPALVVAAFQWLSHGPEAAAHATRPLLVFTAVALGIGLAAFALSTLLHRGQADEES